jgi:hypothetical protein
VEALHAGLDDRTMAAGGLRVQQKEVRINSVRSIDVGLDNLAADLIFEPAVFPVQV